MPFANEYVTDSSMKNDPPGCAAAYVNLVVSATRLSRRYNLKICRSSYRRATIGRAEVSDIAKLYILNAKKKEKKVSGTWHKIWQEPSKRGLYNDCI